VNAVVLNSALLERGVPEGARFQLPGYDRNELKAGVVHIGVGGFHRSHQAMYFDALMRETKDLRWGIRGVGIMPQDEHLSKALHAQDFLYSLTERSEKEDRCRVIGSLMDHVQGIARPSRVFEVIASADTKVVSMTVTEGGYCRDESTGKVDFSNPRVIHDLGNPESPQTIYGYLLAGLAMRKEKGNGPVTVVCCDNIQHNGRVVRKAVLEVAEARDAGLAEWIRSSVSFPNSMVDRITPVSGEAEKALVEQRFGLRDACPVVAEAFSQWVIEDDFIAGRPALEEVGVQFVDDVAPFERMKIRLLNASHSAMGYLAYLLGYRYIHEVAQAEEYQPYLQRFMDAEMTPLVGEVQGVDLGWYKASLLERFRNEDIRDTVLRICSGGSAKIPGFVLPAIQEAIEQGKPIRAMTCVVASWLRFCLAEDERGGVIPIEDPLAERLTIVAKAARANPKPYLEMKDIFGSLSDNKRFEQELGELLQCLYENGAEETLRLCSQ